MKRISLLLVLSLVCLQGFYPSGSAARMQQSHADDLPDSDDFFQNAIISPARDLDHSARVEELLAKMTVEEKVRQMTQLEIGMIGNGNNQSFAIDPEKLEKAIVDYGVGSILNVPGEAFLPAKWHEIISRIQNAAKRTRLQIPVIYGIDSVHGANYIQGATLFPQDIGMAATWNPDLVRQAAEITAMETRAAGIPWNFSPVLDIGRQPLWPRLYETLGEDPYLAKVMGAALVRGYEGESIASSYHVASCVKHYMGYSLPLSGQDRTPAWIPEIFLREYVLPTFAAGFKAGAHTVMVNSDEINGVPVHASHRILTDILRGELGFKGVAVSDWADIKRLVGGHHIAATEKEATRIAVMAGIDMSMVPNDYSFTDNLISLVKEGAVPQSRIDEAVRRILELKFDLGLFETPVPDEKLIARIGTLPSRAVSLETARESITLLKNTDNLLPLARDKKVLVTGPTADSLISLNNGWSYTWQGSNSSLYPKDRPTILGAVRQKAGAQNVSYVPGTEINREIDIAKAVEAARDADLVILCLGEASYAEGGGNINDLTLYEAQLSLAEQIAAVGRPIILVLVEGRPRIMSRIADKMTAVVMAYNPGNEGGLAIADVLFGDYNPCGKLPITYPRSPNALFTYDHKGWGPRGRGPVAQFEFGDGLSYTTFAYSDLSLDKKSVRDGDELMLSVTVTNEGQRAGKEVVQLYVRDLVASITPSAKRLKRFAKIHLEPSQSRTLTFRLRRDDFSFIGADNRPTVEPGEFEIFVGNLKETFTLER